MALGGNMKLIDLTGKRFGYLTVIKRVENTTYNSGSSATWLCKCDCGKEKKIVGASLRKGDTKSCGCHRWVENKYYIEDGIVFIEIGENIVKIDEIDLPLIKRERWYINKHNGYAYGSKSNELMHRAIIKPSYGMVVDHINGDRTDNRRENLREATYSVNGMNRQHIAGKSGEIFITYHENQKYYSVQIDGKYCGGSTDLQKAISIRDARLKDSMVAKYSYDLCNK